MPAEEATWGSGFWLEHAAAPVTPRQTASSTLRRFMVPRVQSAHAAGVNQYILL